MDYQEITQSQLPEVRQRILESQNFKCAICSKILDPQDSGNCNVDHQHLFKSEGLGVNGNGLIRGVLCRDCNALEGKIWNAIHRFGKVLSDNPVEGRSRFLKRLLNYYDSNYQNIERILHPKERRPEKLGKSEYNQLIRLFKSLPQSYKRSGELKEIPKFTGLWSQTLKELRDLRDSMTKEELERLFKNAKSISRVSKKREKHSQVVQS